MLKLWILSMTRRVIVNNHVCLVKLGRMMLVRALKALDCRLDKRYQAPSIRVAIKHVPCKDPNDCDHAGGGEATTKLVILQGTMLVHRKVGGVVVVVVVVVAVDVNVDVGVGVGVGPPGALLLEQLLLPRCPAPELCARARKALAGGS